MSEPPHGARAPRSAGVAWLTVSDTRTPQTDRSGAAGRRLLEGAGHRIVDYVVLPDEPHEVGQRVDQWLDREDCDAILTCGGTGIAKRDRTYEALAGLLERRLDGFGELFRMLSYEEVGSAALLSRAVGGIARGKALFALPGAERAVELALSRLILPELDHILYELAK